MYVLYIYILINCSLCNREPYIIQKMINIYIIYIRTKCAIDVLNPLLKCVYIDNGTILCMFGTKKKYPFEPSPENIQVPVRDHLQFQSSSGNSISLHQHTHPKKKKKRCIQMNTTNITVVGTGKCTVVFLYIFLTPSIFAYLVPRGQVYVLRFFSPVYMCSILTLLARLRKCVYSWVPL